MQYQIQIQEKIKQKEEIWGAGCAVAGGALAVGGACLLASPVGWALAAILLAGGAVGAGIGHKIGNHEGT